MLADAQRAYDVVMNIEGVDSSLIVQYGFSFGSSPATHLAQNTSIPASRMIIESGHSTGEALVQSGTLLNIPGSYLLEGAFDNAGRIDDARAPLLILHGVDDTLLPIEKHGDALFDGALNPKTYNRVEGAGHSTIPQTLGEEFYIDLITSFIRGA